MTGKGDGQPVAVDIETERATMTKVRTTFNPDAVLDVDDAEFTDLKRQGLLHSYDHGSSPLEKGFEPWRGAEPVETIDQGAEPDTKKKGDS